MIETRTQLRFLVLALTAAAALCAEFLARALDGPGLLTVLLLNPFAQFACAGPYLMYRIWEPDPARARRAGLVGGGLAIVPLAGLPLGLLGSLEAFGIALLTLGVIGLSLLLARAAGAEDRALWRDRLVSALYIPLAAATAPIYLWLSGFVNPVYDFYVVAFEDTLGERLPVLTVRLLEAVPALSTVSGLCYMALPLGVVALFALQERGRGEVDILVAFAVAGLLGFSLYFVFPVIGPAATYGDAFPNALPPVGAVRAVDFVAPIGLPRNGMPSLHTAWALLVWMNARALAPLLRAAFGLFVAMNLLATVGLPEHWGTDLVVGAPIAVATQALCSTATPLLSRMRILVTAFALTLVAAWFAALWWGTALFQAVPGLSWAAVLGSLAATMWLMRLQHGSAVTHAIAVPIALARRS